jgi:hypothetical protein
VKSAKLLKCHLLCTKNNHNICLHEKNHISFIKVVKIAHASGHSIGPRGQFLKGGKAQSLRQCVQGQFFPLKLSSGCYFVITIFQLFTYTNFRQKKLFF